MRVALAQISSHPGKVVENLDRHLEAIEVSAAQGAELVVFPELSLCGYEPERLGSLAFFPDADALFDPLRAFAARHALTCVVGAPLRIPGGARPRIALFVYKPCGAVHVIEKRFLHQDELPYFSSEPGPPDVLALKRRVGVAICYELSIEAHENALFDEHRPQLYVASVAKCTAGVPRASARLEEIARRHGVPAMMVNCVGRCEGRLAGGNTMAFDASGKCFAQLDARGEGLLFIDTEQDEAWSLALPERREAE